MAIHVEPCADVSKGRDLNAELHLSAELNDQDQFLNSLVKGFEK